MKTFKKILTTTTVLAISAMTMICINASAQSNDDIVLSVTDVNGNMVNYTSDDIDKVNGIIPAYGGITVEVLDNSPIMQLRAGFTGYLIDDIDDMSSRAYNIFNANYTAEIDMPNNTTQYTDRELEMDTSSASNATVFFEITAGNGSSYDEFNNELYGDFYIPMLNGNRPYASVSVDHNKTLILHNVNTDYICYASVTNETGGRAYGSIDINAF